MAEKYSQVRADDNLTGQHSSKSITDKAVEAIGRVQVSKPISRGAAVIGLLLFLLGIALLVSGILLHKKDVNDDIDASEPKLYGLWSAPGPLIVSVFGVLTWLLRQRTMVILFLVVNFLNIGLCIAQAVFVLKVTFWFKDFLTLSNCREGNLNGHGLRDQDTGTEKRDCDDMNTIARFFLLQAISLCFAIVISVGGIVDGILGIRKMKKDEIEQMDGITDEEFRQMEQKTAMWLENNVRFSTGSTMAKSERTMSDDRMSTSTAYRDKSWV